MNVGILTHHWLYNFGANLQALSTLRCLQSLGHNPVIINYRPPKLVERYESLVARNQKEAHASFRDKYLIETAICDSVDDVVQAAQSANLQTVLSGSDAVLRLDNSTQREDLNFPNPFWLDWAVDKNLRTGFLAASSMGSNYLSLPFKSRREVGLLLEQLDYVGVRDNWTKFMLSTCNRQADVQFCPDPVSVFNDVVPDDLYPKPSDENYILISLYQDTLTQSWLKEFIEIANSAGLKVFSLPHPELELDGPFDKVLRLPMSPLQWYSWLKHAKGYVGVRFHPIMIAVANQVPFVALDQYETAVRFRYRLVTKMATALALPWRRHTSKTFDLAKRAGKVKYCLNRRMYSKCSPREIWALLAEQLEQPQEADFALSAKARFFHVVNQIVGN